MTTQNDARPCDGTGTQTADEAKQSVPSRYDVSASLRRRYAAALRLPPLPCGCRDPQSYEHLTDRCCYRRGAAR